MLLAAVERDHLTDKHFFVGTLLCQVFRGWFWTLGLFLLHFFLAGHPQSRATHRVTQNCETGRNSNSNSHFHTHHLS